MIFDWDGMKPRPWFNLKSKIKNRKCKHAAIRQIFFTRTGISNG